MLKQMRTGAKSPILKALIFGMLLLAMVGLALISDTGLIHGSLKDDTIVRFGREKLSLQNFTRTVQETIRNQGIKESDAYKAGLPGQLLRQEIDMRIFAMAAADAGILPDDVMAAREIKAVIAPLVEKGMTQKEALARLTQSYGVSEGSLVAMVKNQLATDQLLKLITSGVTAPQQMVDDAMKFRYEFRRGQYFRITPAAIPGIKEPTESELQSYYSSVAADYALPEYRTLEVIVLDKKSLDPDALRVSDDRLKQYYEENISDYQTPETRVIAQVVASDEAAAKAVFEAAQKSKDLQAASKGHGSFIKPQAYTKKEMAAELSAPAFAAKAGEVAAPVKSALGWHVLFVQKVTPGTTKPFDAVKADIAKENHITVTLLEKIDARGMSGGSAMGAALPARERVLKTAFNLKEGATSPLIETTDGAFVIVGVRKVYPSEQQSLEKVKSTISARWMADQRARALGDLGGKLMERIKQGEAFEKIAAEYRQPVQNTGPIQRGTGSAKAQLDGNLIQALFSLDGIGQTTTVTSDAALTLVRLEAREVKMPATAAKESADLAAILQRKIQQGLLEQYRQSLIAKYDVTVNDKLLATAFSPKDGNDSGDEE